MGLSVESKVRFNLKDATILLVENTAMGMDILVQILVGFGGKDMLKAMSVEEAQELLVKHSCDLVITGSTLGESDGYTLIEWIRRAGPEENRYVPALMVASHTPRSKVERARDCGVHFIIVKPLKPVVILERILWIAREQRRFVLCESYSGPDRRFRFDGPPQGVPGRRHDDPAPQVGDAPPPNLFQEEAGDLLIQKAPA